MTDKYIVMYAKIIDDKQMGAILSGVFFGGICDTIEEADDLATKCVSGNQGGIIIPKIAKMDNLNLLDVVHDLETQFEKLADRIYENEAILVRNAKL